MLIMSKLLRKGVCLQLYNISKYGTIKKPEESWIQDLETMDQQYFKKKTNDYLSYVQTQITNGKEIDELINEVELQIKRNKRMLVASEAEPKQEDYFITKNKEFINYLNAEVRRGRHMDEIIEDAKNTLKKNRISDSEKMSHNIIVYKM